MPLSIKYLKFFHLFFFVAIFVRTGMPTFIAQFLKTTYLQNWQIILIDWIISVSALIFIYLFKRLKFHNKSSSVAFSIVHLFGGLCFLSFGTTSSFIVWLLSALGIGGLMVSDMIIFGGLAKHYQRFKHSAAKYIGSLQALKGGTALLTSSAFATITYFFGVKLVILIAGAISAALGLYSLIRLKGHSVKHHKPKEMLLWGASIYGAIWGALVGFQLIYGNLIIIDKFHLDVYGPPTLLISYLIMQTVIPLLTPYFSGPNIVNKSLAFFIIVAVVFSLVRQYTDSIYVFGVAHIIISSAFILYTSVFYSHLAKLTRSGDGLVKEYIYKTSVIGVTVSSALAVFEKYGLSWVYLSSICAICIAYALTLWIAPKKVFSLK